MLSKTRTIIITLIAAGSFASVAAPTTFAEAGKGAAASKGCTVESTDSNGKKSTISMEDGASITLGKAVLTCNNGNVTVKPASRMAPPVSTNPPVVSKAVSVTALG